MTLQVKHMIPYNMHVPKFDPEVVLREGFNLADYERTLDPEMLTVGPNATVITVAPPSNLQIRTIMRASGFDPTKTATDSGADPESMFKVFTALARECITGIVDAEVKTVDDMKSDVLEYVGSLIFAKSKLDRADLGN